MRKWAPKAKQQLRDKSAISHGGGAEHQRTESPPPRAGAGPQFPSLGVTLAFLERFVEENVRGKASRYCIALSDCTAASDEFLSFKKGEILAIADLNALNDGWWVGYARAGNWADRKKFRPDAVQRLRGLTTDEVCASIIKPVTQAAQWPVEEQERSYARMWRAAGGDGVDTATVFASHAWTFVFEDLVGSLRFFESQQLAAGKPPSYFWLDIFVVDENAAHTYPSTWWQTSFTQAVGSIGHTALVLTPWHSPVPLRRAWCLWEIYSTLKEKAQLSVCMAEVEMQDFHRALVADVDSCITSLCTIDAETAEAGSQNDLDMIFAAVRSLSGGFQTLNTTVMHEMREWLIESVLRALDALGVRFQAKPLRYRDACQASGEDTVEDTRVRHLVEHPCKCDYDPESGVDQRLSFGNWYRTGAGTKDDMSLCAEHYQELSRMQKRDWKPINSVDDLGEQAEFFAQREYELIDELRGDPEEAARCASLLIAGSRLLGEMNQAETHLWDDLAAARKVHAIRMELFGRDDARTAEASCELAKNSGVPVEEQYNLLVEALKVRKATLPQHHPAIADSLKFMGRFFDDVHEDPKTALLFYRQALAILEHNDPSGTRVDTVSALSDVASALEDSGMIEEARAHYERAYSLLYAGQGPRHPETGVMASNLARVISTFFARDVNQSVPLLRLYVKTSEVFRGLDNTETAQARQSLGETLLRCVEVSQEHSVSEAKFFPGDRVKLGEDKALNQVLAEDHGGWREDDMDRFLGTEGTVRKVDSDGDVWVNFRQSQAISFDADTQLDRLRSFCFNPIALTLVTTADGAESSITLADLVRTNPEPPLRLDWSGTDEEARLLIRHEAEALLLRALAVLEKSPEEAEDARDCARALVDLYEEAGKPRKNEMKAMQKRMAVLEAWCSDDSSSESDSDHDSDSSSGSDYEPSFRDVQDILLERNPELLRALQPGHHSEHVSLGMLRDVLAQLQHINAVSPPRSVEEIADRKDTEKALRRHIATIEQRDRAAALLGDGWNCLVSEGTPPPRTRSANSDEDSEEGVATGAAADSLCAGRDRGALTWTTSARPHLSPRSPPSSSGASTHHQAEQGERTTAAQVVVASAVGHGGVMLEPAELAASSSAEEGVPATAVADLPGLVATLQEASPPTHAFGRAATTGVHQQNGASVGSATAEDDAFDALLQQLGLLHHADALRHSAVVNADELRDASANDLRESVPTMSAEETARLLTWQVVNRPKVSL